MARVLDSVTLPIKKNGTKTNQNYVNNPKSTAGQFSTSTAYAVGQYVYYDKKLYRFTTAHAAGAWNASHVTEVTVTSELTSLKAETNDLKQDFDQFPNGNYPNMTVGNAEQLVSTVFVEDEVPYNFRTSGGSADIGDREYDEIVGVSMPINQLFKAELQSTTIAGLTVTKNNDNSYTIDGTSNAQNSIDMFFAKRVEGHKYFISGCPSGGSSSTYWMGIGGSATDFGNGGIYNAIASTGSYVRLDFKSGQTFSNVRIYPQLMDLTITLGTSIADYVYGLEQSTAGSGVSWLKHHFPKIFDSGYIPYNAGEMQSVTGLSAHKMTGFNQWDEEWENGNLDASGNVVPNVNTFCSKNYIPVLPNTTYYYRKPAGTQHRIVYYDGNKTFIERSDLLAPNHTFTTPSNCYYIKFHNDGQTYNHDICINLHWDGERDGEYEAYKEYVYPLDDSVTLRGILKLDSNNQLYADGDRYLPDGTVERRFGVVDLGTLTWTLNAANNWQSGGIASLVKRPAGHAVADVPNIFLPGYTAVYDYGVIASELVTITSSGGYIALNNGSTTVSPTGQMIYELATPTTETAEPYQTPQIVDDWGTEEYVSTSLVPVGHYTKYAPNLRAKLEMAPESPAGNGDYIVRQTNGENEYVALGSTTTIQNILDRLTALENA